MSMACPICSYENAAGAMFCADCSSELPKSLLVCDIPAFPSDDDPSPIEHAAHVHNAVGAPPIAVTPSPGPQPPPSTPAIDKRVPDPVPAPAAPATFDVAGDDDAPQFPAFGRPSGPAAPGAFSPPGNVNLSAIPVGAAPVTTHAAPPLAAPDRPLVSTMRVSDRLDDEASAPAAPPRLALIALDKADREIGRFSLQLGSNLIGIADASQNLRPEVDLTRVDKHGIVSRRHALLTVGANDVQLAHLSRSNPTHVNNRLVKEGLPVTLRVGDKIVFSTNVLCVLRAD